MKQKIGELLLEHCFIQKTQLEAALAIQAKTNKKIGAILIEKGFITEDDFLIFLSQQLGIVSVDLNHVTLHPETINLLPPAKAKGYGAIVLKHYGDDYQVVMIDPLDDAAVADIKAVLGAKNLDIAVASQDRLKALLDKLYG